jgi:hypothetical protein
VVGGRQSATWPHAYTVAFRLSSDRRAGTQIACSDDPRLEAAIRRALTRSAEAKSIRLEACIEPTLGSIAGDASRLQSELAGAVARLLRAEPA